MMSSIGATGRGISRCPHESTRFIERTVIALSMASLRWARRREARFRLTREQHVLSRANQLTLEGERSAAAARRLQLP